MLIFLALSLSPEHYLVHHCFGFVPCDVAKGRDEQVEVGIHPRATYIFHATKVVLRVRDALVNLLVRTFLKCCLEVAQREL